MVSGSSVLQADGCEYVAQNRIGNKSKRVRKELVLLFNSGWRDFCNTNEELKLKSLPAATKGNWKNSGFSTIFLWAHIIPIANIVWKFASNRWIVGISHYGIQSNCVRLAAFWAAKFSLKHLRWNKTSALMEHQPQERPRSKNKLKCTRSIYLELSNCSCGSCCPTFEM